MEDYWSVGDMAHVYVGWGLVVKITPWYAVIEFECGMQGSFPLNQLSRD